MTESLDLPDSIKALIELPNQQPAMNPMAVPTMQTGGPVPSPQLGGPTVGLQPQQNAGPMDPNMANAQLDEALKKNPELVARIRAAIEAGLQTGELNTQDLNMISQMATAVMQNPSLYPQMRQAAIQRGLATEEDLPPQYDEGLVMVLMLVAKSLEYDVQFEGQGNSMPEGGMLKGPSHAQGGIPVKAGGGLTEMEGGEFVIPKHIVKAKGTEFFDKMIKQYEEGGEVKKGKY